MCVYSWGQQDRIFNMKIITGKVGKSLLEKLAHTDPHKIKQHMI